MLRDDDGGIRLLWRLRAMAICMRKKYKRGKGKGVVTVVLYFRRRLGWPIRVHVLHDKRL